MLRSPSNCPTPGTSTRRAVPERPTHSVHDLASYTHDRYKAMGCSIEYPLCHRRIVSVAAAVSDLHCFGNLLATIRALDRWPAVKLYFTGTTIYNFALTD